MPVYVTIPGFTPAAGSEDPLLNEGSLLYLCPAHRKGRWAGDLSTVPAFGEPLPNIAHTRAAALIGSGTPGTLSASLSVHGEFETPSAQGVLERTSNGAFHAIMSNVSGRTGWYVSLDIHALIADYIQSAETRSLYMAVVGRVTRVGGGSALLQRISTGSTTRMSISESPTGVLQSAPSLSAPNLLGKSDGVPIPGVFLMDLATSKVPAGWPGGATNPALNFFGPYGESVRNLSPSWVVYDVYIEDLTVSGLTYAQANAKMHAAVTAQFSPGGIYYNDANTDPATVP